MSRWIKIPEYLFVRLARLTFEGQQQELANFVRDRYGPVRVLSSEVDPRNHVLWIEVDFEEDQALRHLTVGRA